MISVTNWSLSFWDISLKFCTCSSLSSPCMENFFISQDIFTKFGKVIAQNNATISRYIVQVGPLHHIAFCTLLCYKNCTCKGYFNFGAAELTFFWFFYFNFHSKRLKDNLCHIYFSSLWMLAYIWVCIFCRKSFIWQQQKFYSFHNNMRYCMERKKERYNILLLHFI